MASVAQLAACSGQGDSQTSQQASRSGAVEPAAPTCQQRAEELGAWLTELTSEGYAGPEAAAFTLAKVGGDARTVPLPRAPVVEVAPDAVTYEGGRGTVDQLDDRLLDEGCGEGSGVPELLVVRVQPGVEWRVVRKVTRALADAGVRELVFEVERDSAVAAPATEGLPVTGGELALDRAYGACPEARAAASAALATTGDDRQSELGPAIARGLVACDCAADFASARAFHWWQSGRMARDGRVAVGVRVPLFPPAGAEDGTRAPVAEPDDAPWFEAVHNLAAEADGRLLWPVATQNPEPATVLVAKATGPARACALHGARESGVIGHLRGGGGSLGSPYGSAFSSGLSSDEDVYGGLLGTEVGEDFGSGGLGIVGTGRGGGGTGEGTIGVGSVGTIGRGGDGASYGYGTRKRRIPSVRIGSAEVGPGLDKEIIRRYIRRHLAQFRYCYEKKLLTDPAAEGRITVAFVIGPDGKVTGAAVTGFDDEVAQCIEGRLKKIVFPKPAGGGITKVTYPFVFRPE